MSQQMIGRYEVKGVLGRGGMATVFHAFDPRFKRDVAIKVLPKEMLHDPGFRVRFEREAETIAKLDHPAIVLVYDYGEQDNQPFLVMRYMAGGSLANKIAQGSMALPQTIKVMKRIAEGIDEAHLQGIIHRDLKPANILFDQRDEAFLSDFGIVRLAEGTTNLTGSGMVGTPAYMAPEMADADGLSPQVDIYAMGVTLFQMLSGRLPYEADTPMGLMLAHFNQPIPLLNEIRPDLPEGTQQVLEKAMAKDRAARYTKAGDMARDLIDLLGGEPIDTSRTPLVERTAVSKTLSSLREAAPQTVRAQGSQQKQPARKKGLNPLVIVAGLVVITAMIGVGVLMAGAGFALIPPVATAPVEVGAQPSALPANSTEAPAATESTSATEAPPAPTDAPTSSAPQPTLPVISLANVAQVSTIKTFGPLPGIAISADWSPDGSKLVAGLTDGRVIEWDTQTNSLLVTHDGHTAQVNTVAWSPKGDKLVSGGEDRQVMLWEAGSTTPPVIIDKHTEAVVNVAWASDGTRFASAGLDRFVYIWGGGTGKLVATYFAARSDQVMGLTWSLDNSYLATGSDNNMLLILTAEGGSKSTNSGHLATVITAAWSPTNELLASGSEDGAIILWDARTGLLRWNLQHAHAEAVNSLSWSPDGSMLASSGQDGQVLIWDVHAENPTIPVARPPGSGNIVWLKDGTQIMVVEGSTIIALGVAP